MTVYRIMRGTPLTFALLLVLVLNVSSAAGEEKRPRLSDGLGQFIYLQPIQKARLPPILDPEGTSLDLSMFRGRVILLNLWATWCGPCVYEMPALDRLSTKLDGSHFAVVPVSIGAEDVKALQAFYARNGVRHLPAYRTA